MNKELENNVMLIEAINSAVKKINTAKEKNEQELITDDEMQRRLGVSRTTLYNWRKDGTIPYLRIGKKLFYRWKEIINKLG
jgi:excisionase family DNA binding protein